MPTQPPNFCADWHEPGHSAVYSMDVHASVVFHGSSLLCAQLIKHMITALTQHNVPSALSLPNTCAYYENYTDSNTGKKHVLVWIARSYK